MIVIVASGDTLSGIASAHGESLSALEAANPSITNPNVISVGEQIVVPSGGSWAPPPAPAPASTAAPAVTSASSSGGFSVPGMPSSLASCIAYRESTNGTNPAANGNVFGIIPASGYNVAGDSLAQQEQVAGQLYAQYGGSPWAADGCPGT